jgi:hypothetical protein
MEAPRSGPTHTVGDLIYDAIFIGGLGGGLVALFFLVFDVVTRGQALFTPSLMGSVLFDRASPQSVQTVSMLAVARFSAAHLFAFSVFGLGLSFVTHQAEIRARHPLLVITLVFVGLELCFWLGATLAIPGVLEQIGVLPVAAANLLAAVGVGLFLVSTHRSELWARFKRSTPLGRARRT